MIPEERRLLIERILAKVEAGESFSIRDREQALGQLASPEVAGGKAWEAFEREVAGLV